MNMSRYDPLVARTYMQLPRKLQDIKAIINVQNRKVNKCLKRSLRVALVPAPKVKNPLRTVSYPIEAQKDVLQFTE